MSRSPTPGMAMTGRWAFDRVANADGSAGEIRAARCELQRDRAAEGVAKDVDRFAAEFLHDEFDDPCSMTRGRHVAITRGWRLTEPAEVDRVAVDVRLERCHEVGPIERRPTEAMDEHGTRRPRIRRRRMAHGQGPGFEQCISSGPRGRKAHRDRLLMTTIRP